MLFLVLESTMFMSKILLFSMKLSARDLERRSAQSSSNNFVQQKLWNLSRRVQQYCFCGVNALDKCRRIGRSILQGRPFAGFRCDTRGICDFLSSQQTIYNLVRTCISYNECMQILGQAHPIQSASMQSQWNYRALLPLLSHYYSGHSSCP